MSEDSVKDGVYQSKLRAGGSDVGPAATKTSKKAVKNEDTKIASTPPPAPTGPGTPMAETPAK